MRKTNYRSISSAGLIRFTEGFTISLCCCMSNEMKKPHRGHRSTEIGHFEAVWRLKSMVNIWVDLFSLLHNEVTQDCRTRRSKTEEPTIPKLTSSTLRELGANCPCILNQNIFDHTSLLASLFPLFFELTLHLLLVSHTELTTFHFLSHSVFFFEKGTYCFSLYCTSTSLVQCKLMKTN